jgi:methylamine dehydrogenase accessory protein MauD
VRNLFLSALAGVVVGAGPSRAEASMTSGWLGETGDVHRLAQYLDVVTISVVALASIAAVVWRQQGQLAQRLRDLEADLASDNAEGVPAPQFSLPDVAGNAVSLDDFLASGRRLLLVFSDPDCGACDALLPDIGRWQREHMSTMTVAVISRGHAEANRAKTDRHGLTRVLLQRDREIAEAYQVHGTPCAVLVDTDRTVIGTQACGGDRIRALAARAANAPQRGELPVIPHPAMPNTPGRLPNISRRRPRRARCRLVRRYPRSGCPTSTDAASRCPSWTVARCCCSSGTRHAGTAR